jgi:hypothetical protein
VVNVGDNGDITDVVSYLRHDTFIPINGLVFSGIFLQAPVFCALPFTSRTIKARPIKGGRRCRIDYN